MAVRALVAFLLSFFLLGLSLFGCIVTMWFSGGSDFAFEGNGPEASIGWVFGMLFGCFVGSWAAGIVGRLIVGWTGAKSLRATTAAVVLFLMFNIFARWMQGPVSLPEGKSVGDLTFSEAGDYAVTPLWYFPSAFAACAGGLRLASFSRDRAMR